MWEGVWHFSQATLLCFPSRGYPVSRWSNCLTDGSQWIKEKFSPLCSKWQRTQSLPLGFFISSRAWYPRFSKSNRAISLWQSRHLNVGVLVPNWWQPAHWVVPLSDWWAFDSGPGEIWDLAGKAAENSTATTRKDRTGFRVLCGWESQLAICWQVANTPSFGSFISSTEMSVQPYYATPSSHRWAFSGSAHFETSLLGARAAGMRGKRNFLLSQHSEVGVCDDALLDHRQT